jgi:hypothetical protein
MHNAAPPLVISLAYCSKAPASIPGPTPALGTGNLWVLPSYMTYLFFLLTLQSALSFCVSHLWE